jgi:NAD(P)-dependent dehydrogenase (short-subunit alcohol dehydrogenase family)
MDAVRAEMDTNFYGSLAGIRAFAPVIEGNGGGAILNVLSVISWWHPAEGGAYAASKAAGWAMSNAVREELAPRGIAVSALHVGFMDTEMTAQRQGVDKADPAEVAAQALDAIEAGRPEILADDVTRQVKRGLSLTNA